MPKHSLKEILGIFATGANHTHEKAVSDVYDLGFQAGQDHKAAEFQAGLGGSSAPAPQTEGSQGEETEETAKGEDTQSSEGEAAKTG